MKTILIATDGSESADQALEVAIDLARQTGAALEVLSVRPMRVAGRGGAGPAILEVEEHDGPEHIAEAAALRAREAGVVASPHAAHGDVVSSISEAAKALGAELLVVGSRGHGRALRRRPRQRVARPREPLAGARDDRSPGRRARRCRS